MKAHQRERENLVLRPKVQASCHAGGVLEEAGSPPHLATGGEHSEHVKQFVHD